MRRPRGPLGHMFAGRYATPVVVPPCVAIVGAGKLSHDVVAVMGGIEVHRRMWRAQCWIKANSPDNILGAIERFVGSTSKDANLLEIGELKEVADWNGLITPESYARGEKVWLSELTGITQPIKLEDAVADKFLKAAHAKYPA